jgi:hypothetical protein
MTARRTVPRDLVRAVCDAAGIRIDDVAELTITPTSVRFVLVATIEPGIEDVEP